MTELPVDRMIAAQLKRHTEIPAAMRGQLRAIQAVAGELIRRLDAGGVLYTYGNGGSADGGPGIMVYWHVERKSVCIYSQVPSTPASEVASMIEGLLRHLTVADVDRQYTDTHGAS